MIHHCHLSSLLLDETSCPSSFGDPSRRGCPSSSLRSTRARYAGLCQRATRASSLPASDACGGHDPLPSTLNADGLPPLRLYRGLVQIPEVFPAGVARSVAVRGGHGGTVYVVLCGSLPRSSFAALSISPPVLPGVERRFNLAQYGYPASTSGPLPQAHARASDDLAARLSADVRSGALFLDARRLERHARYSGDATKTDAPACGG
ncbi:hypothetical protein C8R44DRAFT_896155 [Mycena epipterygia]|nr:hypothetical protein C8R44DRAFT_896155 [Mycena epipterygia]